MPVFLMTGLGAGAGGEILKIGYPGSQETVLLKGKSLDYEGMTNYYIKMYKNQLDFSAFFWQ